MPEVSLLRMSLLRATYALIAVGLAVSEWPAIVDPSRDMSHMNSIVRSVLVAVSLLAILGVRRPLDMLPLLLFEFLWKATWLLAFGLPLWRAGQLDAGIRGTVAGCLMGVVIVPLVVPWRYAGTRFIRPRSTTLTS